MSGLATTQFSTERTPFHITYKILSEISRGGMGVVYRAVDTKLNREVALKVLPPELVADPELKRRFVQEAQAAAALEHPNIAVVHEIDEAEGETFVVMELIQGEMLRETFQRKRLALGRSLELATEIAEGLAFAHAKGIVHRDLKPGNIMLTEQGHAKIIDFGLAKLLEPLGKEGSEATTALREETADGKVLGTIAYMSPEQARGQKVDRRSDIFSFGAVLYEMLGGRLPFEGPTGADVLNAILSKPTPRLPDLHSEASSDLQRIVDKCLNKDPNERYQTIKDVAVDLRAARRLVESPAVRGRPATKRVGALVAILSLTVIAFLAFNLGGLRDRFFGTSGLGPIQSLAVLPLENLSGDPEQEYFADGMTEALIAELGKIGALRVISRTSVMMYKEARKPLSEIARELNVDAVVEGSVLRSGERVRITTQLVQAAPEQNLWAERYERDMKDILALQSDVARAIAGEIEATVTPIEETRLASALPVNPEAHDAYLKGRYYLNNRTAENLQKSLESFQEAISKDPESPLAYAGLSESYISLSLGFLWPSHRAFPEAKAAAAKALQIDDQLAEAHVRIGRTKYLYDYDWVGAEKDFKRAIELNPNDATAHHYFAILLSVTGRFDQALKEIRLAQALDPLSGEINMRPGQIYRDSRRYDEAIEQLQRTLERGPTFYWTHTLLGEVYLRKGMHNEAIAAFQRGVILSGELPSARCWLACGYAIAGERREALTILDDIKGEDYVSPMSLYMVYAALGETNLALDWLEIAYQERDPWLPWIKVGATPDPIRSHPRFQDLIRRMNFPE